MGKGTGVAAISSATAAAALSTDPRQVWAVVLCLLGVLLSRWVYVGRESRRGHRSTINETVGLTLLAMLIAGSYVASESMNPWKAAFVGIGVGWVPDAIADLLGEWVLNLIRGIPAFLRGNPPPPPPPPKKLGDMDGLHELPSEMEDLVDLVDQSDEHQRRPRKRRPHRSTHHDDTA